MLSSLISFSSPTELKHALTGTLSDDDAKAFDELESKGLPPIVSLRTFALILGVTKLLAFIGHEPQNFYRIFEIQKKSGGKRVIRAPRTYLKCIQMFIAREILEKQLFPDFVTGFVPRRGIVKNANLHLQARFLLNIDIEDFFGSVDEESVQIVFRDLGFSKSVSDLLASLCCYKDRLPQGAPTSPLLSNLAFAKVDRQVQSLCKASRISYSRYADDLSFSSNRPFEENFRDRVGRILEKDGFRINQKKTRYAGPGQALHVTGMLVNEVVQPPRELRRRVRAMFHQAVTDPKRLKETKVKLTGWASYVHSYNPRLGKSYLKIARGLKSPHVEPPKKNLSR